MRDLNDSKEEGEQTLLYHDKINKQISTLESQYGDMYTKLNNLEILEEDYGIKIPESELKKLEMDSEMIEQYLKEKAKGRIEWL